MSDDSNGIHRDTEPSSPVTEAPASEAPKTNPPPADDGVSLAVSRIEGKLDGLHAKIDTFLLIAQRVFEKQQEVDAKVEEMAKSFERTRTDHEARIMRLEEWRETMLPPPRASEPVPSDGGHDGG